MGRSQRWASNLLCCRYYGGTAETSIMCSGKPPLLPRILNLQRAQLCYIVGTVYLDMPLKPNVLEDMARNVPLITSPRSQLMLLVVISTGLLLQRLGRSSTPHRTRCISRMRADE